MTLHQLLQGIRISDVGWLHDARCKKVTKEEDLHRRALLAELVYFLFDSFLMPLLRTTFYSTEAQRYRYRVLYFRQDDWMTLSGPLLDRLKESLFQHVPKKDALAVMSARQLGYSRVRLVPKERGVRAIVNLRRRSTKQGTGVGTKASGKPASATKAPTKAGKKNAGPGLQDSINQILQSAFHILTYEKKAQAKEYASSVLGPNEIFTHLKNFQRDVLRPLSQPKLFFVKMDVRCAFDTIEQGKLLEIVKHILQSDGYFIAKRSHVVTEGDALKNSFHRSAMPDNSVVQFEDFAETLAAALRHVIFVDGVWATHDERARILLLLEQHVGGNLVKIGKDFYRQRIGIPQGSSLSTLLCSFFYADLERKNLAFAREPGNLLLRYTDDFLFITTRRDHAERFFKQMSAGHPEYGCFVSEEKTLANFELTASDGSFIPRCREDWFPWCGYTLNTETLAVRADLARYIGISKWQLPTTIAGSFFLRADPLTPQTSATR